MELQQQQSFKPPERTPTQTQIEKWAEEFSIALEIETPVIKPGWENAPKGLLQVLWERGWVNPDAVVKKYTLKNNDKNYSLRHLMSQCEDFQAEQSAMEFLAEEISRVSTFKVSITTTPKYHCELAGEGIEYSWGLLKRYYRRLPLSRKNKRELFHKAVKECVGRVNVTHARKFAAKTRRYMLTYAFHHKLPDANGHYSKEPLSYSTIEKYVKTEFKTHRSAGDQEAGYIADIYRESLHLETS